MEEEIGEDEELVEEDMVLDRIDELLEIEVLDIAELLVVALLEGDEVEETAVVEVELVAVAR